MKNFKLSRRVLACVLAISMVLGMSSTSFATVEDLFTENTINYVSLGASNVNGYGLDGYLPEGTTAANKNTANVFGYRQCPEGSYVDFIRDSLVNRGYTVNESQLAISSMRVEELRVLLDESYYGDAYTAWRFIGPGKWFENAAVTGGLDALRADYAASVADANLITVDIGVNNFGVYLSNQLASGGTAYDDDLSLVDPELAEVYNKAKEYVYDLIAEHAGEYSAAVSELDFVVDAMAYALAGFCVNFDIVMEKIYELNPDATVVAVSIQNLMEGLEATIPGVDGTVPFGELFGALVDVANLYIAVGSPYSDEYLFADVSENGRVEFFLDQLLAYDGNPASLDNDMRDCFDVYDDDLMVSTRVEEIANGYLAGELEPYAATLASIYGQSEPQALLGAVLTDAENNFAFAETISADVANALRGIFAAVNALKPVVLNAAYDVVAEIMQLGAQNNVLDLAVVLAGGYGNVEDGLLGAIEAEVMTAINAAIDDPTFEYSIDEDFLNDIADAAYVPASLVNTVATLGIRTSIGNSFYGHPNRNGHVQIATAIIDALENNITGFDALLERLDITEEYEDAVEFVNYIEAEIRAIIDFAKNGTYEEKEALVKEVIATLKAELGITAEDEEAANEIIDEIKDIIDIAQNGTDEEKEALIMAYVELLKAELGITAEDEEAANKIKDIIDIAQNGTDEEKEALIMAYVELLKAELGITAEDEAKAAEFAAIAFDIIDIIKNTSKEDVKVAVDEYLGGVKVKFALEFAKLGHKHYAADEDSYYVAIGGDTLFGTGITRQDKLYSDLVSDALGLENGATVTVAQKRLLATKVADLVMSKAQDIAAADLITYQLDASSFINSIFSDEDVDWSKYIDAEVSELFNAVIEEATAILTADWAYYANAELDEVLAEVLPEVQAAVAEYAAKAEAAVAEYTTIDIDEEKIDAIISLGISSVKNTIDFINAEKDEAYANVVAEIDGIDDMVIDFAEKIAYTIVSFAVESVKAVETIQTINPEATLLVVGMYNPLNGLEIDVEGETYGVGEMFEYVIDVTNAFYYSYAAINNDFAFVDVYAAEANGFSAPVVISDIETAAVQLVNLLRNADENMHANAAGHVYIKDQIVKALTCNYSVYEQLDADNHTVKCSICDYAKTETHDLTHVNVDADKHKIECSVCDFEAEADHNWDAGVVTTQPTHTEYGEKTYTCPDCSATKTEQVAKDPTHSHGSWENDNDNTHSKTCACDDVITENHNWDAGVVTTQPTHTEYGEKTYTCPDCSATKTEQVAKDPTHSHGSWVNDNDNTHSKTCACGDVITENHNLTYASVGDNKHKAECSVCDFEAEADHNLTYTELDADNHTAECPVCHFTKTEAHDFNGTTTCTKCAYTQPAPTPTPSYSGGGGAVSRFTISFETNGGSTVAKVFVTKGKLLAAPANPTKAGFVFDGWYTDKALTTKYDFTTPVTKSFTLYAKWIATEETITKFTDIYSEAWYYDYVKTIIEKRFMNGISETEFAPNATLTRGMFVTILYRIEGEPAVENDVNFTDVNAGQYYENAVKWATANGIVKGITETEFAPDAEVTREQMAAMISRYADYKKLEVPEKDDVTYIDSDMISEYAISAVNKVSKLGIIIGNTDGSFAPKKNATRAEAATLFVRLLGVLEK